MVFGQRTFLTKRPLLSTLYCGPYESICGWKGRKSCARRRHRARLFCSLLAATQFPSSTRRSTFSAFTFRRRRWTNCPSIVACGEPPVSTIAWDCRTRSCTGWPPHFWIEQANERSALFVDHIALAFHAHVTDVYGKLAARAHPVSGGLSPWQRRHALDFMVAPLGDDPTIAQMGYQAHVLCTDRTPLLALRSVSFCRMGLARWSASGGQNTNSCNA